MNIHLCTDASFLEKQKSKLIKENVVLIEKDFFYELKSIFYPHALTQLKEYIPYIQNAWIYIDFSMISFVNAIFIIDYFYQNQFIGNLSLVYYQKESAMILFEKKVISLAKPIQSVKDYFFSQQKVISIDLLKLAFPHILECLHLFSLLQFEPVALHMLLKQCLENEQDMEPEIYFMHEYANFGLSFDYVKALFQKIKKEESLCN